MKKATGRRTPRNPPSVRRVEPYEHDPYRGRPQPADGTACEDCAAVFSDGRWTWRSEAVVEGRRAVCPACQRVRDRYPAGVIELSGALGTRGPELVNLFRNVERAEREEHPLERLMDVELDERGLRATTTGTHLARRIASALGRQLPGVEIRYGEGQSLVRVEARL